jgi:soluble lytic murein transglycosylase-like protein
MILCVSKLQHRAAAIQLIPQSLPGSAPAGPVCPLSREAAHAMIRAAALKHNVPAAFVKSIVAAESNFDPSVVSSKGAIGLMQLMPELALEYGVDPRIPEQNIDGGTRYLKALIQRYQKSRDWLRRTIAAYNAGPGMVDKYRGVPPFRETRTYVARVLVFYKQFQREG